MVQIKIETEGFEDLAKRARDPKIVHKGLNRILFPARTTARKEMEKRISGGSGEAIKSIFARINGRALEMIAGTRIRNPKRQIGIEEGRPPGEWVPFRVLQKWMKDQGIDADPRNVQLMKKAIFDSGTEGKNYISGTMEVIRQKLPEWNKRALKSITRSLTKKGLI